VVPRSRDTYLDLGGSEDGSSRQHPGAVHPGPQYADYLPEAIRRTPPRRTVEAIPLNAKFLG
jgi:hypothetical protein